MMSGDKLPAERQSDVRPADFPAVAATDQRGAPRDFDFLSDVKLRITAYLGTTKLKVRDIVQMRKGGVIKLDKLAGEMADLYINDVFLGKAEIMVLADAFGLRVSSILREDEETQSDTQEKTK